MLLIGKPSIFMGHLYHGYVSHNQMVNLIELDDGKIYRKPLYLMVKTCKNHGFL